MHGELGTLAHTLVLPPTISLSLWDEPELHPLPDPYLPCPLPEVATKPLRLENRGERPSFCHQPLFPEGLGHELGHSEVQVCVSGQRMATAVPILATNNVGRWEPLTYLQSRYQIFPSMEVAIHLGTPVLNELGLRY